MKVFLSLFLGALISSTSPVSLLAQSAKIEANASNNNKNRNSQENLPVEEHQVTVQEYCDFLNAVADSDTHSFYEDWMGSDPDAACILRSGTPGNYCYSVVKGKEDMSIRQINLLNQARYCNWLENGQPAGPQVSETTENGVYTLNGDKIVALNPNATYFLKSDENEFTIVSFCSSNPHLDVVPQLMMDPVIGEESFEKWIIGERRTVDKTAWLLPSPARNAVHTEDPEQREISKFFSQVALKTQDHYLTADALLLQVQSARDNRTVIQQAYNAKAEALEQAQGRFDKEQKELENKDLNKTSLGRAANAAAKASSITNIVNTPIVSLPGLLGGASTVLDIVNRRWEKASFKKAKKDLENAEKDVKTAEEKLRSAGEAVDAIESQKDELEKAARDEKITSTKTLAKALKPPVLSLEKSDWTHWATTIVSAAQGDSTWVPKIADKGRNNPTWAANKAAITWAERLRMSEESLKNCEDQKTKELQPLGIVFNAAQAEAETARSIAYATQDSCDAIIKEEINTKEEYDIIQNLLRELGKRQKTPELAQLIKDTEAESRAAYVAWQKAIQQKQVYEQANQLLVATTEDLATAAEKKAWDCYKKQTHAEKQHTVKIERAHVRLEADRAAWRNVWPEELLDFKLRNTTGEAAFTAAMNTQNEEAWMKAHDEALELAELWGAMRTVHQKWFDIASPAEQARLLPHREKITTEQTVWNKRGSIAQAKAAWVKTKNLWIPFSEAVKTFVENPNFDPDFKNAKAVVQTAEFFASEAEKAKTLVDQTVSPNAVKALTQIILATRNVANAAKVVTNAIGSVPIQTLRDVAKDTIDKTAVATENVEGVWKEEAVWLNEATCQAATFAKNIAIRQGGAGIGSFNIQEFIAPNIIHKHYYYTQVRYMRARRNIVGKIEPQKEALASARKAFSKKEKRLKGKKGLLDARKKLAIQWKAQTNEIIPTLKTTIGQNNQKPSKSSEIDQPSVALKNDQAKESIIDSNDSQVSMFEDIATQENLVNQEGIALNEERGVLERKGEEIKARETALARLDEKSNEVRIQEIALSQEKEKLANERAAFEQQRDQNLADQGALAQILLQKEVLLRAKEMKLVLEHEFLAKSAESQDALSSTSIDHGAWALMLERLDVSIELEKNAVVDAEAADINNSEEAWKKAQNAALNIAALWDEIIRSNENTLKSVKSPVEKERLLFEMKNARNEKSSWNAKAAEWARRAAEDKTVIRANATNVDTYLEDAICDEIRTKCLAKVLVDITQNNSTIDRGVSDQNTKKAEIRAQIEALKQLSLESKIMKDNSSDSSEQRELEKSIDRFSEAAEYLDHAIRAIVPGALESTMFVLWREAAAQSKESAEQYIASAQALKEGYVYTARRWDSEGDLLSVKARHAKYLAKANEAKVVGNSELAEKWNDVESKNQQAVDPLTKSVEAYDEVRKYDYFCNEGKNWNNAGNGFYYAANKLAKAIEVEIAGKPEIAKKYREAAAHQACSVEPYTKAARAYAEKKDDDLFMHEGEGPSWNNAGNGFYYAADKLERAIEAEVAGKVEVAKKYREAAEQQSNSVRPYIQAVQAYAAGKKKEGENWNNAGDALYYAADKLEKAIEAKETGKLEIAEKWNEAAKQQSNSVELYIQAARAYAAEKINEGESWNNAGGVFDWVAEKLVQAIEAELAGKLEIARKYRAVLEQQPRSIELYTQAARAYKKEKNDEGLKWICIGNYARTSIEKIIEAIEASAEATIKAIEAKALGKDKLATEYSAVADQFTKEVDMIQKTIQACTAEREEELDWLEAASDFIKESAKTMIQAIEAKVNKEALFAAEYDIAVAQFTASVIFFEKASQENIYQATQEHVWFPHHYDDSWASAGYAAKAIAETIIEAIKAKANVESQFTAEYNATGAQFTSAIAMYENQNIYLGYAGDTTRASAETMIKAIEAKANGDALLAMEYNAAAIQFTNAAGMYAKAVQTGDSYYWDKAGDAIKASAKTTIEAIEAKANGKDSLSAKYNAAEKKYRQAADKYKEAAKFREAHPYRMGATALESEGKTLSEEAAVLVEKADEKDNY